MAGTLFDVSHLGKNKHGPIPRLHAKRIFERLKRFPVFFPKSAVFDQKQKHIDPSNDEKTETKQNRTQLSKNKKQKQNQKIVVSPLLLKSAALFVH